MHNHEISFLFFFKASLMSNTSQIQKFVPTLDISSVFQIIIISILKTFMISIIDLTIKTPYIFYTVDTDFSACVKYRFTFYTFLTNTVYDR